MQGWSATIGAQYLLYKPFNQIKLTDQIKLTEQCKCACRVFKAIEWILFRSLLVQQGYSKYITVFYFLAAVILATVLLTVWVALVLKGSDTVNVWLKR